MRHAISTGWRYDDRKRLQMLRPTLARRGMSRHLSPLRRIGRLGTLAVAMMTPGQLIGGSPLEMPQLAPLSFQSTITPGNAHAPLATMEGVASWYSRHDPGIRPTTASMEPFDDQQMTCALWGVPFGTMLRVTNMANGRAVTVRVNDRGPKPYLHRNGRIVDLTRSAFAMIAPLDQGLARVRVELLPSKHDLRLSTFDP